MRNRGQALVEFIMVLPILLFLILAFFDVSRIVICKNHLENVMDDVIKLSSDPNEVMINNFLAKDQEYDIVGSVSYQDNWLILLETNIDLITPGIKNILGNPYHISVERRVISE